MRGRRNQAPARATPAASARYSAGLDRDLEQPEQRRRGEHRSVGRHELRIEGDHEDRRLGVGQLHDQPLAERSPTSGADGATRAARRPGDRCRASHAARKARAPRQSSTAGADDPQHQVGDLRRRHERGEPRAGEQRPAVEAELQAEHRRHGPGQPAQRRAPEDQRHRRTGRGRDQQHGQQERRQRRRELHARMLAPRRSARRPTIRG